MQRRKTTASNVEDVPVVLLRAADWLIFLRLPLLLLSLVTAGLALAPSLQLEFDRSIEGLFHEDDPSLISYIEDQDLFGGAETVIIAYSDPKLFTIAGLKRLEGFHSKLNKLPGILSIFSLAKARLPGSPLDSRSLREHLSAGNITSREIQLELQACDLYRGRLLSEDGETTLLLASLATVGHEATSRKKTIEEIRAICNSHDPPAVLAGGPVIVEDVYRHLEADGRTLGITSSLVLAVVICLLFRNLRWILLPLAVVHLTLICTKALLVVSGMKLSMVSSPLVALVTVIGVATVVHVTIRFREERNKHDPQEALKQTMIHIGPAIFWTCLTTAAGFSSLLASRIMPVGGFGVMMAVGALLVFIATMCLLPAGVLLGRFNTDPARAPGETKITALLDKMVAVVESHPRHVTVIGLGFLGLTSLGLFRLQVATDFDENFRRSSPIVQSYQFLADRMGTMSMFDVLIDTPNVNDQKQFNKFLERVQNLQQELNQQQGVKGTLSIVNILDFILGTRKDQAGTKELIQASIIESISPAQRLVLLQSLQPGLTSSFWNREHNVIKIVVQCGKLKGAQAKRQQIETLRAHVQEQFPSARLAGVDILLTYLVKSLLSDQWITFSLALAAILIMMMIAFRDWRLGLIALIPNVAPILIVVGVMGWAGLKVNMATAMLASVSMGLAVDFSIHYLYRFRYELRAGKTVSVAIRDAHGSVGLAMVLANFALVAGFSTLTISEFIPTVHFGILVSVAMLGGLAGNLISLPLLLRLLYR
jgi:uncharacterized protein